MPIGCDILVVGSVPAGSGLSSSAAMVVASTLAFLTVNNKVSELTKGQLVEMSMANEQRVGKALCHNLFPVFNAYCRC